MIVILKQSTDSRKSWFILLRRSRNGEAGRKTSPQHHPATTVLHSLVLICWVRLHPGPTSCFSPPAAFGEPDSFIVYIDFQILACIFMDDGRWDKNSFGSFKRFWTNSNKNSHEVQHFLPFNSNKSWNIIMIMIIKTQIVTNIQLISAQRADI